MHHRSPSRAIRAPMECSTARPHGSNGMNVRTKLILGLVLASLLLLTRFWPVAWSGMWVYYVVAGIAILPVAAVGAEWWKLRTDNYVN